LGEIVCVASVAHFRDGAIKETIGTERLSEPAGTVTRADGVQAGRIAGNIGLGRTAADVGT
jgi:hypothetical protein